MPRIRILPVDLRNKIAAGEVIERPASVVKELVENAIDAGSTSVRVDILRGGKRLVRVSDDGSGMDPEDALLCFERHGTSKLGSEEGLFDLKTMGFRGEALPSIASVSRVRLVTGLRETSSGVSIEIEGGELKDKRESPFAGTTIEARDLFFNTPARSKFLKSDSTESMHIIDIVTKEALSHPGIGFSLSEGGREVMLLPKASGHRERIMQVYGEELLKGLIEIKAARGRMKAEAYCSRSSSFRNSRSHQFVFICGRPVKDQTVSSAIYRSYEGILPQGRHPIFFLFLEIDPREVDFNVHPAKREVRFRDKEEVFRFIHSAVREAVKEDRTEYSAPFSEAAPAPGVTASSGAWNTGFTSDDSFAGEAGLPYRPSLPSLFLGETFFAVSGKGGLMIVDHHAAHERILYEKFLRKIDLESHSLLFPRPVRLSHKEYRAILENKGLIGGFGIEIDDFGEDTILVRSLPESLAAADIRGILADAAAAVLEHSDPGRPLRETIAARIACHSSVRGETVLNKEEIASLLGDLEATEHPDQCPHGRPTRVFMSIHDLKKLFKRK